MTEERVNFRFKKQTSSPLCLGPNTIREFLGFRPDMKETVLIAPKVDDPVNHPKHYTNHPSGVECIDITRHMNFNLGNVVKYIWRAGLKDTEVELQDLQKAAWYLNDEINRRNPENGS